MSSRRTWIKITGLTALGLATGSGGFWIQERLSTAATAEAAATAAQAAAMQLQNQLASAQLAQSDTATSLSTIQQALTQARGDVALLSNQRDSLSTALEATKAEAEALRKELDAAQKLLAQKDERLAHTNELVQLYDQLDAIGLDALAQAGLGAMAGGLADTTVLLPTLQAGLTAAKQAVDDFVKTLPDMRNAVQWLSERLTSLSETTTLLEKILQSVLNATAGTGLLAMFGGFSQYLFGWLPTSVIQGVNTTLKAIELVLTRLMELLGQSDAHVLIKMKPYASTDADGWATRLVTPVRDRALTPAEQLLQKINETNTTFETQLRPPVTEAIERRAQLRARLKAFRQETS